MTRSSWVPDADGSGFDLAHLPYGVVVVDGHPRPAVRIGAHALDLRACAHEGLLGPDATWADADGLTPFLAAGHEVWAITRAALTDLLADDSNRRAPGGALHPLADLPAPLLPVTIGDYIDFYSSLHHATNIGRLLRPDDDPLLPNWRHLPIGYHGRAGTVVASGTPIRRPIGQRRPDQAGAMPPVGPSTQLDLELEVGFVVGGPPTPLGQSVAIDAAAQRIFGIALVNDWSARDIQAWEYRPLGPFLAKSFATSMAPWITPLAALDAAWVPAPVQAPLPAPYLRTTGDWALDLTLEVALAPAGGTGEGVITRVGFADMYWTMPQQLAHATSGGASIRPGDLFASGTVSGPERGTEGCLLEMTHGGSQPFTVAGASRTFLADGDTVTLRGHGKGVGAAPLTLAEVSGTIRPAAAT
ncbi:MAG TPA: fumarylacetoacetase [Euzebya sp.]|nr:fumarylacetoacetase [Euzebya sp.]